MKIIILAAIIVLSGCASDMPIGSKKMSVVEPIPKDVKILFDNGDPTQSKITQKRDNFVTVQNLTIDANILYEGADEIYGELGSKVLNFAGSNKEFNWKIVFAFLSSSKEYCADQKMVSEFRQVIGRHEVLFECLSKDRYVEKAIVRMVKRCDTRQGAKFAYQKPTYSFVAPIVEEKSRQDEIQNIYNRYLRAKLKITGDEKELGFFPCADLMKLYMQ
jgi:hypothetical protein